MKTVLAGVAATAALLAAMPVSASPARPTYDSLWQALATTPNCPPSATLDLILVQCKGELTIWYFTRPNHPAHPGVIKREITTKNGDWFASEQGWSFGPDSAQPAFQKLLAQIADLDRQIKEAIARDRAQAPRN